MTTPSTASSDFINNLLEDLLLKILLHLSTESVFQCKSVCKRWRSLISTSSFVERFLHIHHQHDQSYNSFSFLIEIEYSNHVKLTNSIIKIRPTNVLQSINFLNFLPHQEIYIAACFKDLLVCRHISEVYDNVYYICNPLTRQYLMLPPAPKHGVEYLLGFVCYPHPCNKNQTCTTYARYKYKVVRIHKFEGYKRVFNVDIFCSERGKWSEKLVRSPKRLSSLYGSDIVVYNGILHWVDEGKRIVAYDPLNDAGRCRVIDSPTYNESRYYATEARIGICKGRLRILQRVGYFQLSECVSTKLSMWELEDFKSGKWKREEQVNVKDFDSEDYEMMKQIIRWVKQPGLLGFHPNDEEVVYLSFPGLIVECNLRTKRVKEVCKLRNESGEDILGLCGTVYPLQHPWWPTPVPPPPAE